MPIRGPDCTPFDMRAADDGHYYLKGSADGAEFRFMIDTGASTVALPREAANQLHLSGLQFDIWTITANGPARDAARVGSTGRCWG